MSNNRQPAYYDSTCFAIVFHVGSVLVKFVTMFTANKTEIGWQTIQT